MPARSRLATAFAALALLALPTALMAQEEKAKGDADRMIKAEGVIVKVEPIGESSDEGGKSGRVRVTVNTAAVWRDWVRDQTTNKPKDSPKSGENSVATKGQPVTPADSSTFEVGKKTRLASRFRSSTDETNAGSRTVEKAEKRDGSPESDKVRTSGKDEKAPKVAVSDLKVGQFVEFEARKGQADRLFVLKPIGGPDTPASQEKPAK